MKHIGVIGCGGWGKNHVRTWAELGALHSICDGNQAALDAARPLAQGAFESTDASAIIDNPDIKGVVIATPSPTHYALVMRALEAGKDVLVEKPMALKVADAEKMNAKAKEKGCLLMVGHVLEFHPAILKLREFIQSGELGKVLTIQSNRLNLGKIRNEENALWSFAPHDLAIILRLVGEMPIGVSCHGGAYLNSEIADSTITALEFRSKVLATISVSWLYPYKEHTLVVVGSKQMAVFNDLLPWEEKLQLYPHRVQWTEGKNPIAERAEPIRVPLQKTEPLKAECEHFLSCIKTRAVPLTDGASGFKVLTLLQGAQTSLDKRGQMVSLGVAAPTPVPDTYVHPTAIVDKSADLGTGTKVWHYSHVMGGAKFGKNCVVGQNVFVAKNVVVGNGVKIQNNVSLYEGVVLEDFVFCGPSMVFTNVINPRSHIERKNEYRKTIVGRGATIGANATIVCGHNIGRFAFIGAGAVVTKDIPSHALVVGNPARVIGFVCECGVGRLDFQGDRATCASCKRHYRKAEGQCQEESQHVDESTATRLEAAA